jgi:hypothetical protein
MHRIVVSSALLWGLVVAGCGSGADEDSVATDPTETSGEPARSPSCAEVWVAGRAIPTNYKGCSDGDTWVRADISRCESGQVLVTYANRFYGAKGSRVNDVGEPLAGNKNYQLAVRSCGG